MNWLTQMIHTPIDLRRMYPAESCRRKQTDGTENLLEANNSRSKVARGAVIDALGDNTLTAVQLQKRIKGSRDAHSLMRLLRKMEKDGEVVSIDPGNGKNIQWRVK
jgi:hypothetical protein